MLIGRVCSRSQAAEDFLEPGPDFLTPKMSKVRREPRPSFSAQRGLLSLAQPRVTEPGVREEQACYVLFGNHSPSRAEDGFCNRRPLAGKRRVHVDSELRGRLVAWFPKHAMNSATPVRLARRVKPRARATARAR